MSYDYLKTITSGIDRNAVLHDLMEEYGGDVWRYAYFLTQNKAQCDDITQDVFVKVYEKLHTFRTEAAIKTWILTITRNVVRDYWRSAWLRKVMLVDKVTQRDVHPSAEYEAMEELENNEVWSAVLALPKKLREPLLLFAHHQLSIVEIASLLDVSQGTVKSRIFRARARVSKGMAAYNDTAEVERRE